jgi:hypothetical protein
MVALIMGGVFLSTFFFLWYLEDREGGGPYDPDPSASFRYRNRNK